MLGLGGRVLAEQPLGPGFLDAALDGNGLVVLRTESLDDYQPGTKSVVRTSIVRGLGGNPVLCGANGGVAAYLEGVVVHVVSFRDHRDIALRIPDAAPPFTASLHGQTLTVAYQQQDAQGFVGTIPLQQILG